MVHRREWLGGSALAAAGLALPPEMVGWLRARPRGNRPYLDLAIECARWIATAARQSEWGVTWPADPGRPESDGLDFYNGMPGVVLFLTELAQASGDPHWGKLAAGGTAHIVGQLERIEPERLDAGLYTGLAGLAMVLLRFEEVAPGRLAGSPGGRALDLIARRARRAGDGVTWTESHDIISGSAGTGLLLLAAFRRTGDARWLRLAAAAGVGLLAAAKPSHGGLMWLPGEQVSRNYPNFSHGTAGVAYFLATLHQRTGEHRFLDAARAGAHYLDAIAVRRGGEAMIHHHDGGGEDLFYLSWCHGPPGTARLFHRLHAVTGEARWAEWIDALTRATLASGIPERRTPGFWNNISQCCGNVGVGEYFLALSRTSLGRRTNLVQRILDDAMRRASRDASGLRWIQAEHRVQPENLVAQTGYMQGSAGVGTFLLRLDAHERGEPGPAELPDSPFAG